MVAEDRERVEGALTRRCGGAGEAVAHLLQEVLPGLRNERVDACLQRLHVGLIVRPNDVLR